MSRSDCSIRVFRFDNCTELNFKRDFGRNYRSYPVTVDRTSISSEQPACSHIESHSTIFIILNFAVKIAKQSKGTAMYALIK